MFVKLIKISKVEALDLDTTGAKKKPLCVKCQPCFKCEEKQTREYEIKRDRFELEPDLEALNTFFFYFITLCMIITNLLIWIIISV